MREETLAEIMGLEGVQKLTTRPILSQAEKENYQSVFKAYRPLIAELTMERLLDSLVTGDIAAISMLKIMAPHLFQKEATVIEAKITDGSIQASSQEEIQGLLSEVKMELLAQGVVASNEEPEDEEPDESSPVIAEGLDECF